MSLEAPVLIGLLLFLCADGHELQQRLAKEVVNAVTILVKYPATNLPQHSSIFLRGGGCGLSWDHGVQMKKKLAPLDTWEVIVGCAPDTTAFPFKLLIDDTTWSLGGNTRCEVRLGQCVGYPWFSNAEGEYVQVNAHLFSSYFKNFRDIVVYLPPSYPENTHKVYPTLLMHDGQNLFNDSTSFGGVSWHCAQSITELIMQEKMEEIIVIGINNTPRRIDEYTYSYDKTVPGGGDGDEYLDFVFTVVLDYVNRHVTRAMTDGNNLSMLGSSLGGLISCYAGFTRPEKLRSVGCMSSSFWWNNEDFNTTIMASQQTPSPTNLTVYLDSGNAGTDGPQCTSKNVDDCIQTITVRTHFESLGWVEDDNLFYYVAVGGQHSEKYWGARFHEPMLALYGSPK